MQKTKTAILVILFFVCQELVANENVYGADKVVSFDSCKKYKSPNDQVKCINNIIGVTEERIIMEGGVCADDPLRFSQKSGTQSYDLYYFEKECLATYSKKDIELIDSPPTSFSCRSNSKLLISGSTYTKNRSLTTDDDPNSEHVPDRYYIYKCTMNCNGKPMNIIYSVVDCG